MNQIDFLTEDELKLLHEQYTSCFPKEFVFPVIPNGKKIKQSDYEKLFYQENDFLKEHHAFISILFNNRINDTIKITY